MRLAVVVVLGCAACGGDPSLRVDVVHAIAVARTTISVYESPSFSCDEVKFGDLSEGELVAARVAELTIENGGATSGSLEGLSRTEPKVIVARGYDQDGTLATGGCKPKGEIKEHDRIEIPTVRAALASIGPLVLQGNDPFSLTVALTDTRGIALRGNELSWRVYGPSGSTAAPSPNQLGLDVSGVWHLAEPACANNEGIKTIHPVPPSTVGGFAVQVRPAWAIEPPPLVSAFTRIDPAVTPLLNAGIRHPCAIRATPSPTIVCVEATSSSDPTLIGREYRATVTGGNVTLAPIGTFFVDPEVISLYTVPRPGTIHDVYAVTRRGRVLAVQSPTVMPAVGPGLRAGFASDALFLPRCSPMSPPRVLMRVEILGMPGERKIVVMDELGSVDEDFHAIRSELAQPLNLRTTGCVTELEPKNVVGAQQAVVVDLPARGIEVRQVTSAYFDCVFPRKEDCYVDLPLTRGGAGFFPGDTPLLAGANVDASGVVVSRWAVLFDNGIYRRVELGRTAAAAIPLHIVYGQFDDDGKHDAFWDVLGLDPAESNFQLTYSQLAGDQPLSALSGAQPLVIADLLVGDVTNDAKDDLVLLGTSTVTVGTTTTTVFGLAVLPPQVPALLPALEKTDRCP